ncbi:hypothetical protein Sm713_64290 [Streptomyces sp. TS71-3]|nr:hypothetical protein Sm713_64290 [Streptomyces sp. TS71-3]
MACIRAHEQAHRGDMQLVVDAGGANPRINCIAAPLRLSSDDVGAVWLMLPGGVAVSGANIAATHRMVARIVKQLARTGAER